MKSSTSFEERLRAEFQEKPVGFRVELPDGSTARIVEFIHDDGEERLYRVQGVTPQGRFCKLPAGTCHWYSADELYLLYYTASVKPEFLQA